MKHKRLSFFLKILFHIFLGTFLGCSIVVLYVSSNGTLQDYVVQKLQNDFEQKYQCKLACNLDRIDWFSLRMHFSQVSIRPLCKNHDQEKEADAFWSIIADKFVLSASWWNLITRFKCRLSGMFEHLVMHEIVQSSSYTMQQFLTKLFEREPGTSIEYDWMSIADGLLLVEQQDGFLLHVPYVCNMSCEYQSARMQWYAQKGKFLYKDTLLLDNISGSFICDLPENDVIKTMNVQLNMGLNIVPLGHTGQCFVNGSMKHGLGSFVLRNEDLSFVIDPIQIRADSKKCLFDMSIVTSSSLCKQLELHEVCQNMQGIVQVDCRGDLYDFLNTLQVDVTVDNVAYKSKTIIKDAKIFVQYQKPGVLSGQLASGEKQWFEFVASRTNGKVSFRIFNHKDLYLSQDTYWKVPAQGCVVELHQNDAGSWQSSYVVTLKNHKLQEEKRVAGKSLFLQDNISIDGNIDDIKYEISVLLSPVPLLEKALFTKDDKKLVDFYADESCKSDLFGTIDFSAIHYIVSDVFKSSFAQDGTLKFKGHVQGGVYYSKLDITDANIRIPRIYNVIQNIVASCEIDMYERSVKLKDIKADLHEGEIVCSQANFFFERSGACYFMHVPLLLHNVLLSWDKGIFMLLSGGLFLQKQEHEDVQLSGQLIVEKSQLKENIFSSEFQEKLFGKVLEYDDKETLENYCSLDVSIVTKDLLQVKTSFLSTKARLDLLLKGTVKKPDLSGVIQLVNGSFYFPYKSLDIVEGKLFFMPGQQFDPLIEVFAKGKLKRFGVGMHVSGSVFDPHVQFEAAPYLTEEQIVSLLLLGMEDNSLSVMVPAILTQKLKDLVFGPALSKAHLQSRFDRLLNTFKYFRFLPQFTNQTGRGGMRGIFEIDASDHLHGRIDTNFMQLEDTKFDVDLALTDDITFRVQKDGPSTYGGEVELRWKFEK